LNENNYFQNQQIYEHDDEKYVNDNDAVSEDKSSNDEHGRGKHLLRNNNFL